MGLSRVPQGHRCDVPSKPSALGGHVEAFSFADSPDPIRSDLAQAYRKTWIHIASPGTWLTGVERVAVADET